MDTFGMLQAAYDAMLPDYYDNPGHGATPDYCALCEEPWAPCDEAVETTWGRMHLECADSYDAAEAEAYAAHRAEVEA